ncbi:hypothetical protein QP786_05735 [Gleimia europaea]|nr:hypothetical protein [Gleimia europaea]
MPDTFDPVNNLLAREGKREGALRDLAEAMMALQEAVSNYRDAHKAAVDTGWAKRDLNGAGFFDVAKLPKVRKINPSQPEAPAADL